MKHRWDWSEFQAFLSCYEFEVGKITWITDDTFMWVEDDNNGVDFGQLGGEYAYFATFTVPSDETHILILATLGNSASQSAGSCSVFWHALATSNCVKPKLSLFLLFYGPALLQFYPALPSLELLEFSGLAFNGDDCLFLATLERTGPEVTFCRCSFDAQGEKNTFIEWLQHTGRNQT